MASVAAVLGIGPHGQQLVSILRKRDYAVWIFDDKIPGQTLRSSRAFGVPYIAGAAWPSVRREIAARAVGEPLWFGYGWGSILFPGAQVGDRAAIGDHVHIEFNAVVSHGCKVGDFVTICPGVVLAGEVTVEDDVFIGANATVIHGGITIGKGALIGAGAVVLTDVPAGEVVKGVYHQ